LRSARPLGLGVDLCAEQQHEPGRLAVRTSNVATASVDSSANTASPHEPTLRTPHVFFVHYWQQSIVAPLVALAALLLYQRLREFRA
jgi:hypothetical protein